MLERKQNCLHLEEAEEVGLFYNLNVCRRNTLQSKIIFISSCMLYAPFGPTAVNPARV